MHLFCALTLILTLLFLPGGQAWSASSLYVPESGSLFWLDILDEGETIEDSSSDFTLRNRPKNTRLYFLLFQLESRFRR